MTNECNNCENNFHKLPLVDALNTVTGLHCWNVTSSMAMSEFGIPEFGAKDLVGLASNCNYKSNKSGCRKEVNRESQLGIILIDENLLT